jgi:hypothetical protein
MKTASKFGFLQNCLQIHMFLKNNFKNQIVQIAGLKSNLLKLNQYDYYIFEIFFNN